MARDLVNVRKPMRSQQYRPPEARYGRSQIQLTPNHMTTFDAGRLIPYFCEEVEPGDTFTWDIEIFGRVWAPLEAPIMSDIFMNLDIFYVPNRIIWDNWYAMLGTHDDAGAQDTTFTVPILSDGTTVTGGTLHHYFGLPIGLQTTQVEVQALPFRAYFAIYNRFYRDQNVIDKVTINTGNGPDGWGSTPWKSAKPHDYFTSALPYLQKGTAQTVVDAAPIHHVGSENNTISIWADGHNAYRLIDANLAQADVSVTAGSSATRLYANVEIDINTLREAAAIQRLLEKDARAGTRPPEMIKAHFGVDVPDYRISEPEYCGGGIGHINTSAVANTSADGTNLQGHLAGVAAGGLRTRGAKSFVEHGWLIGILRARAGLMYHQGLDRKWSRQDRYDYMWPELAHLGEQPIYNKELYVSNSSATDDGIFGFQERYADKRWSKPLVTGQLDPAYPTVSLDFWHLAEDFGSLPSLNQTFIEDQTPMSRVTAVDSQHDFIVDGRVDLRVARVLPVRPLPSLLPARF